MKARDYELLVLLRCLAREERECRYVREWLTADELVVQPGTSPDSGDAPKPESPQD